MPVRLLTTPAQKTVIGHPIVFSGLSKVYRQAGRELQALKDINLTIQPGVFGLLGRNGAGKTTLLQILATLLPATQGTVHMGPYEVQKDRWKIRRDLGLGFLPQEQGYYPKLTVKETLIYLSALQGIKDRKKQIDRVLEEVNLSDRAHSLTKTLSGGMRRRLGLAQALLGDPQILIVDEPTTGLDPVEQQRFRVLLGTLGAQKNRTILLSTHIVADLAVSANRLAVLEKGVLIFDGQANELTDRARDTTWLWRAPLMEIEQTKKERPIVITAMTPVIDGPSMGNEMLVRIVGIRPSPTAIPCEPSLEDGYFSILEGAERGNNDK